MDQRLKLMIGLTNKEAKSRIIKFGYNELSVDQSNKTLAIFLRQFKSFFVYLLTGAGLLSILAGEVLDGAFIFLVVFLNAFFGFYQEQKAEKLLQALKKIVKTLAKVYRDGELITIESRELVVDDIILLGEGDKIPADIMILECSHLEVDESSLTGESLPVEKNCSSKNIEKTTLYMGTTIMKGEVIGKVIAISVQTKIGSITTVLSGIEDEKTPLQKKLDSTTSIIGVIGILLAIAVFILLLYQGDGALKSILFAISLAVAIVPEGLPAVIAVTLALGVQRMAKRSVIVKRLTAIESLGSTTLIATDKTGTLTTNQMTPHSILLGDFSFHNLASVRVYNPNDLRVFLDIISLANSASLIKGLNHKVEVIGNSTEGGILMVLEKFGYDKNELSQKFNILDRAPFDQVKKRITVKVSLQNEIHEYIQGAPEYLAQESDYILIKGREEKLESKQKDMILGEIESLGSQGYRVVALGEKYENGICLVGIITLNDPIRESIKQDVINAKSAGIHVVMITGDNEFTSKRIATEAGIMDKNSLVITGMELDNLTDKSLLEKLPQINVFARTTPMHKLRLVKLFQELGYQVAVTGDGVNDALALKQAEVGIAMGKLGTEVAKETADIVLTDDNFTSLMHAVLMGRSIYKNIKNAVVYIFCTNLTEVIIITGNIILNTPYNLTALQLLYVNMVSDVIPAISFGFTKSKNSDLKNRYSGSVVDKKDLSYMLSISFFVAVTLLVMVYFINSITPSSSRTLLFVGLIVMQIVIYIDRFNDNLTLKEIGRSFKNPVFFGTIFSLFGGLILVMSFDFTRELMHLESLHAWQWFSMTAWFLLLFVPVYIHRLSIGHSKQ